MTKPVNTGQKGRGYAKGGAKKKVVKKKVVIKKAI